MTTEEKYAERFINEAVDCINSHNFSENVMRMALEFMNQADGLMEVQRRAGLVKDLADDCETDESFLDCLQVSM